MLLMAIAGGMAFSFKDFKQSVNKGNFFEAIRNNLRVFQSDFRLIKPKKFGLSGVSEVLEHTDDYRKSMTMNLYDVKLYFCKSPKEIFDNLIPAHIG